MKSDKELICHCLLFVFIKREVLLMHKIIYETYKIYETYNENVIVIRTFAN